MSSTFENSIKRNTIFSLLKNENLEVNKENFLKIFIVKISSARVLVPNKRHG